MTQHRAPRQPLERHAAEHRHGHSIYEPEEFLDAPEGERIPPQEVSLARRFANPRTIGSILFALLILVFLARTIPGFDFGAIWSRIAQANPSFLIAALAAYYLTFPLRGFRWRLLLARAGCRVSFPAAVEIVFLSWFVNCLVPAKLGDLYRAYLLRENFGASVSRTVGSVFIERIFDLVVMVALVLAAGYWSFRGVERPEIAALFLIGLGLVAGLLVLVVALRLLGATVIRRLPARLGSLYERFHQGSVGILEPRTVVSVLALTGLIWAAEGMRLYFTIRALGLPDAGLGISASIFVALAASLLTAVPLTPAGIGFVEAGIVAALALYGVEGNSAAAVALTDRAITILSVILLGGALYAFSGMVRRAHGLAGPSPGRTTG